MKINKDIEIQLKQIMAVMKCSKDFECYKTGFETICKIKKYAADNLCACLEKSPQDCLKSLSYGDVYFCKCQLRLFAAQKLNK